ncbi:hypothetical protein SK128_006011 [Halocaridina rubra]|uniref:Uncharacterized protein n=1 Tax=Halocaridina rubra TaxID=373956 RepID=A0AAN8X7E5_HALRR
MRSGGSTKSQLRLNSCQIPNAFGQCSTDGGGGMRLQPNLGGGGESPSGQGLYLDPASPQHLAHDESFV